MDKLEPLNVQANWSKAKAGYAGGSKDFTTVRKPAPFRWVEALDPKVGEATHNMKVKELPMVDTWNMRRSGK